MPCTSSRFSYLLDEVIDLRNNLSACGIADGEPGRSRADVLASLDLFCLFGITRVGDVTGLDTLGIPTWFACRPNSRSLSVSQGKGVTHSQARISAIMEAVEGASAERPKNLIARFGSYNELGRCDLDSIPLKSIKRVQWDGFNPDAGRGWVPGISFPSGNLVYAPYELIGLDFRMDMPWDHQSFLMTSVGLAAGFTLSQATVHALYELVENDATAALEMFGATPATFTPLKYVAGEDARLDEATARLADAGAKIAFGDCSNDIGLPVICAFINWPNTSSRPGSERVCAGFACRTDPHEAALAALLEAAQSRLTNIAGSRDDIPATIYAEQHRLIGSDCDDARSIAAAASSTNKNRSGPSSIIAKLRHTLNAVLDVVGNIYVFPLDAGCADVRVVRVLADKLETIPRTGSFHMGARAFGRLLANNGVRS